MTTGQVVVFCVLGATLCLFVWNRWRYDLVALSALLILAIAGYVPADQVFTGLGHPAVVTVAAVLVISRALSNAGVVDAVARLLARVGDRPWTQIATLTGLVALCSAFMNNVGALALLMPVAISMARRSGHSPSLLLMPLAFGSLLGGMLTMIGTPPNIIIAEYRAHASEAPFGMFDFTPVGIGVVAAGVLFIALLGWRLMPKRQRATVSEDPFEIEDYMAEVRVPKGSEFSRKTIHSLVAAVEGEADIVVIALERAGKRVEMPSPFEVLQDDDQLMIEAETDSLGILVDITDLEIARGAEQDNNGSRRRRGELTLAEVVVAPGSLLVGSTPGRMQLRERYGLNVLAVARRGERLRQGLGGTRFIAGDVLLVQGDEEQLQSSLKTLGCLPLASRGLRIGRPRRILLAGGFFAVALVTVALGVVPAAVGLMVAAVALVLAGLVPLRDVYPSIDWPIIILLAAMMPIGQAMENTGGSQLIADGLLRLGENVPAVVTIAVLMVAVMHLSNVVNNAAAAVLAAPVALALAQGMGASPEPLLMAVAIGASSAFLTPIGHQSNMLVMAPGGYGFGDYWRMGLPLSLVVLATALPLIMLIWPL